MNKNIKILAELSGFDMDNEKDILRLNTFSMLLLEQCITLVNSLDDSGENYYGNYIMSNFE